MKRFAVLLVPIVAMACGGTSGKDPDALDDAVAAVHPSEVGRIAADARAGSSSALSPRPSRTVVVVGESRSTLLVEITQQLEHAGFTRTGATGWGRRDDNDKLVTVFVATADSSRPPVADDRTVRLDAGDEALVLRFVA
jgi:hypothetical protein